MSDRSACRCKPSRESSSSCETGCCQAVSFRMGDRDADGRHQYLVKYFKRKVHQRVRRVVVHVEVECFQKLLTVLEIQRILKGGPIC